MNWIYLDNSATTRPCAEAVDKITELLTVCWGNPSSLHGLGFAAEQELSAARRAVARSLSCTPEEIFFTSGGTESDNMAIFGTAHSRKREGKKIITSRVEHPAVLESCRVLEQEGFTVEYIGVDPLCRLDMEQLKAAVDAL